MSSLTAIGFDLFDTLITMRRLGAHEAPERLLTCLCHEGFDVVGTSFFPVYREVVRGYTEEAHKQGKETHNRFWISTTLQRLGYPVDPDDTRIANAIEAYFSAFLDHAVLLPDTLTMLDALRSRYRLGLLSNFTHPPVVKQLLSRLGLTPFFEVTLISGELGYRKPHQHVFQELIRQFDVPREQIAFVGDDPQADIDGARRAGLWPIWTVYGRQYKATLTPEMASPSGSASTPLRQAHCTRTDTRTGDGDRPSEGVAAIASWQELLALLNVPHALSPTS
jgi:putative hydrolase of the HAD superfamily